MDDWKRVGTSPPPLQGETGSHSPRPGPASGAAGDQSPGTRHALKQSRLSRLIRGTVLCRCCLLCLTPATPCWQPNNSAPPPHNSGWVPGVPSTSRTGPQSADTAVLAPMRPGSYVALNHSPHTGGTPPQGWIPMDLQAGVPQLAPEIKGWGD